MALRCLPRETLATYGRLVTAGCPGAYVERLLLGCDHGEIGAQGLRRHDLGEVFVVVVGDGVDRLTQRIERRRPKIAPEQGAEIAARLRLALEVDAAA